MRLIHYLFLIDVIVRGGKLIVLKSHRKIGNRKSNFIIILYFVVLRYRIKRLNSIAEAYD